MTPAGFPHSDIPGSKPVCGSPRLFAAYHVLRRLLVPRHPPCALSSLTGILISKALTTASTQRLIFDCQRSIAALSRRVQMNRRAIHSAEDLSGSGLAGTALPVLVEIAGLEPAASGLQSRRSPS